MAGLLFSSLRSSPSCALLPARAMSTMAPTMYVGAELPMVLVKPGSKTHAEELMESSNTKKPFKDPFEGMPFRMIADYLGDRLFPNVEEIRVEESKKKKTSQATQVFEAPAIPHVLPITRWASKSENFRKTLVVDETTTMKPRLSWYHPDDTLVPRDWFKKGLLEDIKYYKPFF